MASAKNYTEEMVNAMTTAYSANPTRDTVDALAREFGKTTRSKSLSCQERAYT